MDLSRDEAELISGGAGHRSRHRRDGGGGCAGTRRGARPSRTATTRRPEEQAAERTAGALATRRP